ncbi:MAG: ATP-binding protein [Spirochaetes bacterium]|nr:ATP-binding protein [Spirochaetota bacterium]
MVNKMRKSFFNVAGPCNPGEHYMLDPFRGIHAELTDLVDSRQYFVIYAARQSGKTTLLKGLARQINTKGDYYALYCSLETVTVFGEPEKGIPEIVWKIESCLEQQNFPEGFAKDADYSKTGSVLQTALVKYCRALEKPLVIFFDEADCLSNGTLITFLRQLRDGYINRLDVPFIHSVALVGMRNIRDYKSLIRPNNETVGSASPFNIMTESLSLRNFTKPEVAELYAQHTAQTGQIFEAEAIEHIFEQTQGQPWLVNAIARNVVKKITKEAHTIPITKEIAKQGIENIIFEWGTHFDSMMERLKEPRVRNVIKPLILGEDVESERSGDYLHTRDLGLIREVNGKVEPANPLYAELMIRSLNWDAQRSLEKGQAEYIAPRYLKDGKLDITFLIRDFQTYWRENSEIWTTRYKEHFHQYDKAAPHLVIQAFLNRVVNGGGQVVREMALGTKRADLCVIYGGYKYPIELKIYRGEKSVQEGREQLSEYMDKVGAETGWLVMFDRDTEKSWDDKIYMKEESLSRKKIVIAGC